MQATSDRANLVLSEVAVPQPGPQQLLVRMRAASLNRGEFIVGHGLTKAGTAKPAGMEGAGEIAALGAGVAGFKVGERVMGRCAGAFSEYALMDTREAIALPPNLSFEEGASIPLTFLVALRHAGAAGQARSPANGCWSRACRPASAWPACKRRRRWARK